MKEFKIRKATDPINIKNIIVVIFGDPNMGKTSLSFTADMPLHLDYDRGYHRAVDQKDSLEIDNWQDGIDLLLSTYIEDNNVKTLVIDTVGTMLDDFAADFIIKESAKNGKPGGGLALQGYGALKEKFRYFKSLAQSKGVDLVFLCHSTEEKEGDIIKKIPKITGGSYDILKAASDLVGFMEMNNGKRTLDFNSTDRHDGKNCPEFEKFTIPHYTDEAWGTYLKEIIKKTKDKMNNMSEANKNILTQIDTLRTSINECKSTSMLNNIETKSLTPISLKIQIEKMVIDKRVELWEIENIATITTGAELNSCIDLIKELDVAFQKELKKKLIIHADKLSFVFNVELKQFVSVNQEPKKEPVKENFPENKNIDSFEKEKFPEETIKKEPVKTETSSNVKSQVGKTTKIDF